MSFTVGDVAIDVREMVQDTSAPYRYDDAFVARKVTQVVRRAAIMRPDLFTQITTISCIVGSMQTCPADSIRIMDVVGNSAGEAVKEVNQEVLDLTLAGWELLPAGPATNWMRYPRDPNRFYVYPQATAGAALQLMYAKSPSALAMTDVVPIQDAYMPAIIDGTCWLLEAIDAEHVESGRAKMFQDSFNAAFTSGLASRQITDTESGGTGEAV